MSEKKKVNPQDKAFKDAAKANEDLKATAVEVKEEISYGRTGTKDVIIKTLNYLNSDGDVIYTETEVID